MMYARAIKLTCPGKNPSQRGPIEKSGGLALNKFDLGFSLV
jgi:hypothetical protein